MNDFVQIPLRGMAEGFFAYVSARAEPLVCGKKWYASTDGYAVTFRGDLMHRIVTNAPIGMHVDHINFENLRVVTQAENLRHSRGWKNSGRPYKGVDTRTKGATWRASISPHGKKICLGMRGTAEEAALLYDQAALHYFGHVAYLNFPERIME